MTRLNVGNIRHPDASADSISLNSSARVGIGASSPEELLHLSSASPKIKLTDTTTGADHFLDGDSGVGTFWVKVDDNAEGSNPAFIVDVGGTERLRIDSSGNVGIGGVSPGNKLYVVSATPNLLVEGTNATSGNLVAGISVKADSYRKAGFTIFDESGNEDFFLGRPYAGTNNFAVINDGQERLRIDSSGRVGIGTSSPTALLDVVGAAKLRGSTSYNTDETAFFLGGGGSIQSKTAIITDPVGSYGRNTLLFCQNNATDNTNATSSDAALAITSSGNVGIGTTSPGAQLDVRGSSTGDAKIRLDENGSFQGALQLRGNDLEIRGSSGTIEFYRGNNNEASSTEIARFDTSGRLLVGTSTARDNFFNTANFRPYIQLEGTSSESSRLTLVRNENNSGGPGLLLGKSRGSSAGSETIAQSNDDLGLISFQGADGDSMVEAARIQADVNGTPGSNNMPGQLSFFTNSGTTSVSERLRITSDGAWGLAGANYGSSGQVLTSQGSSAAPQWATVSSDIFAFVSFDSNQSLTPDSKNVSSVSNTSTGLNVVNFTTSHGSTNYSVLCSGARFNAGSDAQSVGYGDMKNGSVRIHTAGPAGTYLNFADTSVCVLT